MPKPEECQDKCPARPVLDPVPAVILKSRASGPKSLPRAKPRGTRAQYFDLTRAAPQYPSHSDRPQPIFLLDLALVFTIISRCSGYL